VCYDQVAYALPPHNVFPWAQGFKDRLGRKGKLLVRASTEQTVVVPANRRTRVPIQARVQVFGTLLKLLKADDPATVWDRVELKLIIHRPRPLPDFPLEVGTIVGGKFVPSHYFKPRHMSSKDREVLINRLYAVAEYFRDSQLHRDLRRHEDDPGYEDINAESKAFLETMDRVAAMREGHVDMDADPDEQETILDLLVDATLHLAVRVDGACLRAEAMLCPHSRGEQNIFLAGEELDIHTRQFNATITQCSAAIFEVFYQEYMAEVVLAHNPTYHYHVGVALPLVMFLLQFIVSKWGPVRRAPSRLAALFSSFNVNVLFANELYCCQGEAAAAPEVEDLTSPENRPQPSSFADLVKRVALRRSKSETGDSKEEEVRAVW